MWQKIIWNKNMRMKGLILFNNTKVSDCECNTT